MKPLFSIIIMLICAPCYAGSTFEKDVYPVVKSNVIYLSILQSFCFHPTDVHIVNEGNIRKISTLAAFSENGEKSVGWSNYVRITLEKNDSANEYEITGIEVTGLGPNYPCFQPEKVVTIGKNKSLINHTMQYPDPKELQWVPAKNGAEQHGVE